MVLAIGLCASNTLALAGPKGYLPITGPVPLRFRVPIVAPPFALPPLVVPPDPAPPSSPEAAPTNSPPSAPTSLRTDPHSPQPAPVNSPLPAPTPSPTPTPAPESDPLDQLWPALPDAAVSPRPEIPAQMILNYLTPVGGTNAVSAGVLVPAFIPPAPPSPASRSSRAIYEVK